MDSLAKRNPLALALEDSPETAAEVLMAVEVKVKEARALLKEFKEGPFLEWLQKHGRLEVGEVVWYVGTQRKVKLTDKAGLLDRLSREVISAEEMASYLASEPFKQGSIRTRLGDEEWEKYFTVEKPEKAKSKPMSVPKGLKK